LAIESVDCGLSVRDQMIDEGDQMALAGGLMLAARPQQIG
jgi:hypothetical protein